MNQPTIHRAIRRALHHGTTLLTAAFLCALSPSTVSAGDRELEILVVNMTPDPVSEAASTCAKELRRTIRADYTHMLKKGESATRRAVGDTTGEDFMGYTAERLSPLREGPDNRLDAIVLFDCRPDSRTFRALVLADSNDTYQLRLDRLRIDKGLVTTVAEIILGHAWLGFSP